MIPGIVLLHGHRLIWIRADRIDAVFSLPTPSDPFNCEVKMHGIELRWPVEETPDEVLRMIEQAYDTADV